MKILHKVLACLAFTTMTTANIWAQSDAAKTDVAKLQGEWVMVSGARDGATLPKEYLTNSRRIAKGGEVTVTVAGQLIMHAKFTLDPSKQPKNINYAVIGGPHAGKTELGIYEIEGDTVKFCFAIPGEERPGDFSTKLGDHRTLSTWKRATP